LSLTKIANSYVWVKVGKCNIFIDFRESEKLIYNINLQDLNINHNSY
jgi:hypothetical protein